MFIKVFVPNANGKIELSVQELEALLKDAADKAVHEKCAGCNRGCWTYNSSDWGSISTMPNITYRTPSSESKVEDNIAYLNGGLTVTATANKGE